MSILIQFVHPYPERSRANRAILEAAADIPGVVVNDLYALYPNLHVDARREQQLLSAADLVVFQHPLYWYSGPALLKEWIDVVLAHGYAYGPHGTALQGKDWLQSLTTGMPGDAYAPDGYNGSTLAELLKPFERTASFCGMNWLDPIVFHDAHASSDDCLRRHVAQLRQRLESYCRAPAEPVAA